MRCVFLISDHAAQSIGKRAARMAAETQAGGVSRLRAVYTPLVYTAPHPGAHPVSAIRLAHCLQMIANFPVASPQILARKVYCLCLYRCRCLCPSRCHCRCRCYSGLATCATFFAFLTPPPSRATRLIGQQLIPVFSAKFSVPSSQHAAPNFSFAVTTHSVKISNQVESASKICKFWR